MCVYTHTHTHTYICTHTHTHTHIYIYIYVKDYTIVYILYGQCKTYTRQDTRKKCTHHIVTVAQVFGKNMWASDTEWPVVRYSREKMKG